MALFFSNNRGELPSVHALIIGVGGYKHLKGGVDPKPQRLDNLGSLGQLTSPPYSAVALAEYLVASQNRLRTPLGTIDLLLSLPLGEPSPLPEGMNSSPANLADIQASYDAWRERCDQDPNNIAIFYFCGHGAELNEQFLLAADFGNTPNQPWREAFAFNSTRIGFNACRAETQCFFVDACREITPDILTSRPNVLSLETDQTLASNCRHDLTIQASARNERAFGRKRKPSYFVQALIKALEGSAASQRLDKQGWSVETGGIANNINRIMRLMKAPDASNQRCVCVTTEVTELMRFDGIPNVPVTLGCNPEHANKSVELACTRLTIPPQKALQHAGAPWSLIVAAGTYWMEAKFPAGEFRADPQEILVIPPVFNGFLECRP